MRRYGGEEKGHLSVSESGAPYTKESQDLWHLESVQCYHRNSSDLCIPGVVVCDACNPGVADIPPYPAIEAAQQHWLASQQTAAILGIPLLQEARFLLLQVDMCCTCLAMAFAFGCRKTSSVCLRCRCSQVSLLLSTTAVDSSCVCLVVLTRLGIFRCVCSPRCSFNRSVGRHRLNQHQHTPRFETCESEMPPSALGIGPMVYTRLSRGVRLAILVW